MKNILLILLIAFLSVIQNASAQAPENVNYQAIARDTAGNPLANQALTVRLSVVSGTALGPLTWQETHSVTTNSFGQYRIQLGTGTSTGLGSAASFSVINWGSNIYFLRTEINPGTGFVNMGTDPLSSVPYALFAKSTSALPNGTVNGQVLSWNGTNWVPASICSLLTQYYRDADGDGFGNPAVSAASCFQPSGYVTNSSDCNDNNSSINPSIVEICNSIDDNCDGLVDNGASTLTDINNCGTCGNVCPTRPNSIANCSSGLCSFTCKPGFANCNSIATDGCEIDLLSNANNCGACGTVCPVGANSTAICSSGVCSLICNSGFGNCNGVLTDGCELNLLSNISNCGACGNVCPARPNSTTTCVAGFCSITCTTGFANCNGIDTDGCEISLLSNTNNCGSCGLICPAGANSVATCVSGTCSIICNSGFANCDGNNTNGCEINLLTNSSNCGSCGNTCPTVANAVSFCSSGICSFNCNSGFANCNGSNADGCEINILTNISNCGSCGTVCPTRANATSVCNSGACSIICNSGFANCNGNNTDGCEVSLLTDKNNCGTCGHICPGAQVCTGGVCN